MSAAYCARSSALWPPARSNPYPLEQRGRSGQYRVQGDGCFSYAGGPCPSTSTDTVFDPLRSQTRQRLPRRTRRQHVGGPRHIHRLLYRQLSGRNWAGRSLSPVPFYRLSYFNTGQLSAPVQTKLYNRYPASLDTTRCGQLEQNPSVWWPRLGDVRFGTYDRRFFPDLVSTGYSYYTSPCATLYLLLSPIPKKQKRQLIYIITDTKYMFGPIKTNNSHL